MKTWLAIAALGLVTLSACGTQGTADDPLVPKITVTPSSDITHPTGADDVILRVDDSGGYVPSDYAFLDQPVILVTGDGRVFLPPQSSGEPHRLLAMTVHQADESQIQALLRLAGADGLLAAPPDYDSQGPMITDASTTVVAIDAGGHRRQHSAYALGLDKETGVRARLSDFIVRATDLFAGEPSTTFTPDRVRLTATRIDDSAGARPWTVDGVDLAAIGGCSVVTDPAVVDLLSGAEMATSFRQGGRVWSVTGAEVLPGDEPCASE